MLSESLLLHCVLLNESNSCLIGTYFLFYGTGFKLCRLEFVYSHELKVTLDISAGKRLLISFSTWNAITMSSVKPTVHYLENNVFTFFFHKFLVFKHH